MRCTSALSISEQSSESKITAAILQHPIYFVIRIMELLMRAPGLRRRICEYHMENYQSSRKAKGKVVESGYDIVDGYSQKAADGVTERSAPTRYHAWAGKSPPPCSCFVFHPMS